MTERFRVVSRSPNSRAAERELFQWFRWLKAKDRADLLYLGRALVRVDQPAEPANHCHGDGEGA
jgi:hypothetical protein